MVGHGWFRVNFGLVLSGFGLILGWFWVNFGLVLSGFGLILVVGQGAELR